MKALERMADLALAIVLFIFSAPILLVILIITKLQLRCNVIFTDTRIGKDGKPFGMYKVTTMKPTPENLAMRKLGPIKKNDPRITRFSRFLRRYSLDELPQFVNVIKGEMSLVGPRPELPHLVEYWSNQLPAYRQRLQVLPGITGLAQIKGLRKSNIDPEKRLEQDMRYVEGKSFWLYLWIILATPKAVIQYEVW